MAANVCVSCRDAKVKCKPAADGKGNSCARCLRRGIPCEPTAPSQRGKRSARPRLGANNRARLMEPMPNGADCERDGSVAVDIWDHGNPETDEQFLMLWKSVGGPTLDREAESFAVLLSELGTLHERTHMLQQATLVSKVFNIDLGTLISKTRAHGTPPAVRSSMDLPAEFQAFLNLSSGYAMVRTVTTQNIAHVTNAAFDRALMSKASLDADFDKYEVNCTQLFVPLGEFLVRGDEFPVCKAVLFMMAMDLDDPAATLHVDVPETVRVVDRRLSACIPCSVRILLKWDPKWHTMFQAIDFTPVAPPQPFTEPWLRLNAVSETRLTGLLVKELRNRSAKLPIRRISSGEFTLPLDACVDDVDHSELGNSNGEVISIADLLDDVEGAQNICGVLW